MQSWIYTEGEKAGKIAGKAEVLLSQVKAKKLKLTKAQQTQIEACTDEATLDGWLAKVLTASSAAEMLAPSTPTKPTATKPKKPAKKH